MLKSHTLKANLYIYKHANIVKQEAPERKHIHIPRTETTRTEPEAY